MSLPQEHDYLCLSEGSSKECSEKLLSPSSALIWEESVKGLEFMETDLRLVSVKKKDLNFKETELRLGLPGSGSPERKTAEAAASGAPPKSFVSGGKREFSGWCGSPVPDKRSQVASSSGHGAAASAKTQVVGWPPIRSFRKNTLSTNPVKNCGEVEGKVGIGGVYVKVVMDGAPYLRKVDLKSYSNYIELSSALERMFSCFTIGQCGSHGIPGWEGLTDSRLTDLLHGSEYVLTYEDKDGDWMLVGDVPWAMFTDSCKRLRIMKGSEAIGLAPRAMEKCKNRN